MKLWPVAEDTFFVNILHFCQNRHLRAQQEVGQGAQPDGGLNCWYSSSVHFPPPPTHPSQTTCSRFQNKMRQSSTFNSNTVAQTSTRRTRISGLPASSESWGSRTQGGTCTNDPCRAGTEHGTSGLLDELLKLNSRHSCHCGFHTSSVRTSCTSAFCVAKKKELELGPSQNTPTLCQCAIQHVWPHAGWTTEFIAFLKVAPWKTVETLPDARW